MSLFITSDSTEVVCELEAHFLKNIPLSSCSIFDITITGLHGYLCIGANPLHCSLHPEIHL